MSPAVYEKPVEFFKCENTRNQQYCDLSDHQTTSKLYPRYLNRYRGALKPQRQNIRTVSI